MRNFQFTSLDRRSADGAETPLTDSRVTTSQSCRASSESKRARSLVCRLYRFALVAALLVLGSACAHEPAQPSFASDKKQEQHSIASNDTFKPSSLAEHPELTPAAASRKFLNYLSSLQSVSDLSPAEVSQRLGVSLKRTASGGYAFRIALPDSGWSYGVDFLESAGLKRKTLSLDFANDQRGRDPRPVCEVGLNDALAVLKQAGYAGGPEYGEIGQLENYSLSRGKVDVILREWARPAPSDGTATKTCLESISVHSAE